ncbi:MAG: hypothetical protein NTW96_20490 [Planctomycetia bacterium]|nr:hypothetical protein [Planctomycetia bacterium]
MSQCVAFTKDFIPQYLAAGAAFSDDILPSRTADEHTRNSDQRRHWPQQPAGGCQATSVTSCPGRKEWLAAAFKRLSRLESLESDWDSYGAEAPHRVSIDAARNVLDVLAEADFEPASVDPSAEGGVCLSFRRGNRYGDIECFNSGEILAVTSSGGDDTRAWEIRGFGQHLETALNEIRAFVGR